MHKTVATDCKINSSDEEQKGQQSDQRTPAAV